LQRQKSRRRFIYFAFIAASLLVLGIALAAMRTVLVAFGVGATLIALRSTRGRTRLLVAAAIALLLAFGALAIWRTRPAGALTLEDHSSSLRWQVARVGLSRIGLHPGFGHGMDAVKNHWTEWGFPGTDMIHLHSTPLQIAFERGLPALLLWLWLMGSCWVLAARAEKRFRQSGDGNRHGLLIGATGAIAGFLASSLFNYNFGDAEVALVFWWLMGVVVILSAEEQLPEQ
jgi:O-antigen ligase